MSQDTKRADPQELTSVQHKLRQFGAALHPAFCILVFHEQSVSDPLVKQSSPLKFRVASGRLQQWRRKMSSSVCLSEGKYHYDLYAILFGMVFA